MTFASKLREELLAILPKKQHCMLAECAGLLLTLGLIKKSPDNNNLLYVLTESNVFTLKYFTLFQKAFNIESNISLIPSTVSFTKSTLELVLTKEMLRNLHLSVVEDLELVFEGESLENLLLYRKCCKRAFLRAVYIAAGTIADPQKSYHFEISMASQSTAYLVQRLMHSFGLTAKIMRRKSNYVVYLQDKESILDMLSIMESSKYSMEMENLCIVKEVRNNANRQTNCDNANISRMVSAALKQVDDIRFIIETYGIEILPENLREIAIIRLENQDESLTRLGELLDPPLSKSGVNHRLRKLSELADGLRKDSNKERNDGKKNN